MKCSFCRNELIEGHRKIFATKTGQVFYFCNSKCQKNMIKLKRKPANTRWIAGEEVKKKG